MNTALCAQARDPAGRFLSAREIHTRDLEAAVEASRKAFSMPMNTFMKVAQDELRRDPLDAIDLTPFKCWSKSLKLWLSMWGIDIGRGGDH